MQVVEADAISTLVQSSEDVLSPPASTLQNRARHQRAGIGLVAVAGCSGGDAPSGAEAELTVVAPTAAMEVGDTVELGVRNARGAVTWFTPNVTVATVSATGLLTAVAPGSALVVASTATQSDTVRITVRDYPFMSLSSTNVLIIKRLDEADPAPFTLTVGNSFQGTLRGIRIERVDFTGPPNSWLSYNLSSTVSTTAEPARIALSVNGAGLDPWEHSAVMRVSADGNRPQDVLIRFRVTPLPGLELAKLSETFTLESRDATSWVRATGVGSRTSATATGLAATASYEQPGLPDWLTVSLTRTTTPAELWVTATARDLDPGIYNATVAVTSIDATNSPRTLPATLIVEPPPTIVLSATTATFTATAGGAAPPVQTIQVTNGGGGTVTGVSYTILPPDASNWLSATLSGNNAPITLTLRAMPGSLAPGTYTANVLIGGSSKNAPQTITATLLVSP